MHNRVRILRWKIIKWERCYAGCPSGTNGLEPKEGLALINGATFSAAIGTIVCWYGRQLCDLADAGLAQSMEALLGRKDAFDSRLHAARGLQGQIESAKNVRHALANSEFIDSSIQVQDGYALRCAPQVHGAVRDSLVHAEHILTSEINAATDNPLIFENGDVISGGNFHGEPIALVMDLLVLHWPSWALFLKDECFDCSMII
jgi:histidine ammonia-lyase